MTTTRQYVRDPQTGKLRPVVYLDRNGNPVETFGQQVLLPPPPSSPMTPPPPVVMPPEAQHYAPPQYSHPYAQPTMPTHTPFLPPGAVPQRYSITVKYVMPRQAPQAYGYGYAPPASPLRAGGWFDTVCWAIFVAALIFGVYWFVVKPWQEGSGLPDVGAVASWGADAVHEFSDAAAGAVVAAAPATADTPASDPGAVVPAELGDLTLEAPPSISAGLIDEYLAEQGSPAAGSGAAWIQGGLDAGIDPAIAIAFFLHESGLGVAQGWAGHKPDGTTTHNVGNIICAGYGSCFGRFRDYPSWEEGIADWYRLIKVEYIEGRGHRTVEDVIPVYAPAVENDVGRYIEAVRASVVSLRQRQQSVAPAAPAAVPADAPATEGGWTVETEKLAVAIASVEEVNGELVVKGTVSNTSDADVEIDLSMFVLTGSNGETYAADSDQTATLVPGGSSTLELTVPATDITLTLTVDGMGGTPGVVELSGGSQGAKAAPTGQSGSGFELTADGPRGCPVRPNNGGSVKMTQGYGVGTHAPAATWGAVDLAIDGDGDGMAEAAGTTGQPVLASHDGVVTATPNSHPAGNHVWVRDSTWSTGYSHLTDILVTSGQSVVAGEQIGTVGSTGMASGPHLDYQVWRSGVNVDPTGLVQPCFS